MRLLFSLMFGVFAATVAWQLLGVASQQKHLWRVSAATCIPYPRGASTFWYDLYKSAAAAPFDDYLSKTLENQCGAFAGDETYCLSNVEACVKPCSSDTQCQVTVDANEGFPSGYKRQQVCLSATESGGKLGTVPPPNTGPLANILPQYPEPYDRGTTFRVDPYPDSNYNHCGCLRSSQCRQSEICYRGVCMCSTDSQCGPGRVCTWGRRPWNFINRSPGYREIHARGQCECDVNQGSRGCNGHGTCVQIAPANGDANGYINRAHVLVARVQSGVFQRPAACACYGGYSGKYCEIETGKQLFCSGKGEMLTDYPNSSGAMAYSRNTGAPILRQYQPDYTQGPVAVHDADNQQSPGNNLARSAGRQACNCEPGWGPDFVLSSSDATSYISNTAKCGSLIPCYNTVTQSVVGSLFNGQCKCSGDFYDIQVRSSSVPGAQFGSCASGCAATICNNRGQCIADPRGSTTYNSACNCNTGFTTSRRQLRLNAEPPASTAFSLQRFCDVPFDPRDVALPTQTTCGRYGVELQVPDANGYMCGVKAEWRHIAGSLAIDPATQLLTRSCGRSENPLYKDQPCGGSGRGVCVSDGRQGSVCQCSNGYKGNSCDELVCPVALYINGGVCSGNGFCDNPTLRFDNPLGDFLGQPTAFRASAGRCVCKAGYIGDACEKIKLDCGVGQTQRNYPLVQNITSIVSLQQLSALQP